MQALASRTQVARKATSGENVRSIGHDGKPVANSALSNDKDPLAFMAVESRYLAENNVELRELLFDPSKDLLFAVPMSLRLPPLFCRCSFYESGLVDRAAHKRCDHSTSRSTCVVRHIPPATEKERHFYFFSITCHTFERPHFRACDFKRPLVWSTGHAIRRRPSSPSEQSAADQ